MFNQSNIKWIISIIEYVHAYSFKDIYINLWLCLTQ